MNEYDDEEGESLFINYHMETRITRVIGNTIIPSKLVIRADVEPLENADDADLSLALTKIKFFFEQIVAKAIAYSVDNDYAQEMFIDDKGRNRTSNQIMTTPGEPNDEVLATIFQSKMNALAAGAMMFPLVEIKADNLLGLSFCFVGEARNVLPTNEEWIGDRSYFDRPWWERNDASTLDVIPPPDADLTKTPAWAYSLDVLGGPKAETGVVVRPSFRPTVIDGGKGPGKGPEGA